MMNCTGEINIYVCQPDSVLSKVALDAGLRVRNEVFADRRYEDDLSLRSRSLNEAVIHNKGEVLSQLASFLDGVVHTYSGISKTINAETICLHSDTEGSAELAEEIHHFLEKQGVHVTAD